MICQPHGIRRQSLLDALPIALLYDAYLNDLLFTCKCVNLKLINNILNSSGNVRVYRPICLL